MVLVIDTASPFGATIDICAVPSPTLPDNHAGL
jgi:hypothetical protein